MPLINPDEIIKNNFKILSKRNKSPRPDQQNVQKSPQPNVDTTSVAPRSIYILPDQNTVQIDELMLHQASSVSLSTIEKTRSFSEGDGTTREDISLYVLEEVENKLTKVNDNENMNTPQTQPGDANNDGEADKDGQKKGTSNVPIDPEAPKPKEQKLFAKRKVVDDDRRRTTWVSTKDKLYFRIFLLPFNKAAF